MNEYPIKIDLAEFFSDARKLSIVLVNPHWEIVGQLQNHVELIFQLKNINFTTDDGYFIPPQASIKIITTTKIIKVIVLANNNVNLGIISLIKKPKKNKRKFFSVDPGFASSTPNQSETNCYKTPRKLKKTDKQIHKLKKMNSTSQLKCHQTDSSKTTPAKENMLIEDQRSKEDSTSDTKIIENSMLCPLCFEVDDSKKKKRTSTNIENRRERSIDLIINDIMHKEYNNQSNQFDHPTSIDEHISLKKYNVIFRCEMLATCNRVPRIFDLPLNNNKKVKILENVIIQSVDVTQITLGGININNSLCNDINNYNGQNILAEQSFPIQNEDCTTDINHQQFPAMEANTINYEIECTSIEVNEKPVKQVLVESNRCNQKDDSSVMIIDDDSMIASNIKCHVKKQKESNKNRYNDIVTMMQRAEPLTQLSTIGAVVLV